jgi:hypothetical protein
VAMELNCMSYNMNSQGESNGMLKCELPRTGS